MNAPLQIVGYAGVESFRPIRHYIDVIKLRLHKTD
jgi:hypothetical protein